MAEDNHGQMLIQQQQPPSQQPQLQQSQLQQSQLQQSQLQQSQLQQSQLQQSQLQQSQIQQSQLQQSQLQQSQLQQSQLQQSQLQQSQIQQSQLQQSQLQQSQLQQSQLHQSQLQQSQLQQSQLQQTQLQQSQVQQSQLQTAMCNSSVEHSSMNVATSVPLSVVSVSQSQQMQGIQQSVNTSSGTPVQMAQLAAQGQQLPAGTMMSQSSGPHPTMMHPTMTMAQAPLQQVQVIQQPASYLQHLYNPQMIFPAGNLTLQHAATPTLQGLGATQGLSLQLQAKTALDPKTSVAQPVVNKQGMTVNAGTMMTASGQVIGTAPKGNYSQQMMSGPGKSTIIHGQSGFAPTNTNQTVVIGQLGVLPNQQSIFNHKTIADSQKGKFTFQSPATLQPKSLYSTTPASSAQVFNGLKQMSSQPQIITTQAPGNMFTQAHQLLGLQTLPAGFSWANPGGFQSTVLGQSPIFIRSQQSDMFIQQSQPQAVHLPPAQPQPPTSFTPSAIAPQKQKQVRMRPGTHSVAVGTQTQVSNATTMHSNTAPIRSQIKPKVRAITGPSPVPPPTPQMATTQTQTQQPQVSQQALPQHKSDAGNQTCPRNPDLKVPPAKPVEPVTKPISPPKSQALVAPSAKVQHMDATTIPFIPITTVSSAVLPQPSITTVATETPAVTIPTPADIPAPQPQPEAGPLRPQQPIGQQVKDKQPPQKAIVKPQVLTHIIDGLVIQEGPEPFPVSRSALLDSPGRILASEKLDSQLKRKDSPAVSSPDKKMKAHRGNVELAKCEFCGKLGPKSKFKRSKRFCSNSCAKRFNVASSKQAVDPEHLAAGGPGRKKKVGGFRGRKSFLKEAEIEERETLQTEDGVSIRTEQEEEDSTGAPVDNSQQSAVELEKFDSEKECGHAQKLATKWSVQDVFEFIRSLPGCCDYADTFRLQEIDGQALLLLKEDHLMTSMSMKLGPALKLISQIRSIKEELAAQS